MELQWVLRRLDPQNSPEGNMTVAEVVALSDFVLSATNKPGETLSDSTDNLKSARAQDRWRGTIIRSSPRTQEGD